MKNIDLYIKRISILIILIFFLSSYTYSKINESYTIEELRSLYSSGDYKKWPKPELDNSINLDEFEDIGVLGKVIYPTNNPYSKEKEELGRILFYDPRLSNSNQIACASCHDPELSWGDGISFPYGESRKIGKRNTISIVNIGHSKNFFWDGRAETLEDQAFFPINDPIEMNSTTAEVVDKISKIKGYEDLFKKAFGNSIVAKDKIAMSIATFERTIIGFGSKFDRFIEGDSTILKDEEVLGLHLFRTKARCINCHNTPYFSDGKFHNIGLTFYKTKNEDLGRYLYTKNPDDVGNFKTPTLRNIEKTAPYMHNSVFPNLNAVVSMYNIGMINEKIKPEDLNDPLYPKKTHLIKPLNLSSDEIEALVSFLKVLTSRHTRIPPPKNFPE